MSKIYADYDDKFVKNTIVYAKNVNSRLDAFKDEACTIPFTADELVDAYLKGAIVSFGENPPYLENYATPGGVQKSEMFAAIVIGDMHIHAFNPNFEA